MTKFTQMLFTGGLLITASTAAQAALVVNFDGTAVDLDGKATLTSAGIVIGNSDQSQLVTTSLPNDTVRSSLPYGTTFLTNGSGGYTGPTLIGGAYMNAVYGATQTTGLGTWVQLSDEAYAGVDVLRIRRNGGNTGIDSSSVTRAALTFVPSGAGPYKFDATSTLTMTSQIGSHTNTGEEGRWLAFNNGTLYVSSASVNFLNGVSTFTLDDPDEIDWAAWTPGTDLSLGSLAYNVAGSTLQNIQRVGYYFDRTGGTGTNAETRIFRADLAVVPEPGAVAVLGVAGLWMTARRRRQG